MRRRLLSYYDAQVRAASDAHKKRAQAKRKSAGKPQSEEAPAVLSERSGARTARVARKRAHASEPKDAPSKGKGSRSRKKRPQDPKKPG